MCLVIDTNTLSCVFDTSNAQYSEFKPIIKWITLKKGKIIYGGSKYIEELKRAKKYYGIFIELKKSNMIRELASTAVDSKEREISKIYKHRDFNDSHIIAIVIVGNGKIICSHDARSYRFLKDSRFYPKGFDKPKIYRNQKNIGLLKGSCIYCKQH